MPGVRAGRRPAAVVRLPAIDRWRGAGTAPARGLPPVVKAWILPQIRGAPEPATMGDRAGERAYNPPHVRCPAAARRLRVHATPHAVAQPRPGQRERRRAAAAAPCRTFHSLADDRLAFAAAA